MAVSKESGKQLNSSCGVSFDYLRLSITGHCQLQCVHCRPEKRPGGGRGLALSTLVELCRALCDLAPIRKIRLTGGEPLLRADLPELVSALTTVSAELEVTLTTNGLLLEQRAQELKAAGLSRINVSLISPDPETYSRMTGGAVVQVLRGLSAARAAGFRGTKINTVVTSYLDVQQIRGLLAIAADNGATLRFIELMPLGLPAHLYERLFLPAPRALEMLREAADVSPKPAGSSNGSDHPQFLAGLAGGRIVPVEMIAPITRPFCQRCRRLRVTRDGWLLPCLLSPVRLPLVGAGGAVPDPVVLARLLEWAADLKGRVGLPLHDGMWAIGG